MDEALKNDGHILKAVGDTLFILGENDRAQHIRGILSADGILRCPLFIP